MSLMLALAAGLLSTRSWGQSQEEFVKAMANPDPHARLAFLEGLKGVPRSVDVKGYIKSGQEKDRAVLKKVFNLLADGVKGSAEGTRRLFYIFPPSQDADVCLDFLEATMVCTAKFEVLKHMGSYAASLKYPGDARQNGQFERLLKMFNELSGAGLKAQVGPKGVQDWYTANRAKVLNDVMEETAASNPNGPFQTLTKRFGHPPDQAEVVTATFCGGPGTEWFSAAAVQPDGAIVAVGGALGPVFTVPTVNVTVLGRDGPAPKYEPKEKMDKPADRKAAAKPMLDPEGHPIYEPPSWTNPLAAVIVVRFSGDGKKILSACRLSWRSGAATSVATDRAGNLYVAGPATDSTAEALGNSQELPPTTSGDKTGDCNHVYVAKLAPAADRVLWVRHVKGFSVSPAVKVTAEGKVVLQGPDVRFLDGNGQQLQAITIAGGFSGASDVSPLDGSVAMGKDNNTKTGMEPYRNPWMSVYDPGGKLKYSFYHFDAPWVGEYGQVSDSTFHAIQFDPEGNLVVSAWSDGGNTVLESEPLDMLRRIQVPPGLPMGGVGGPAMGACHLMKIDLHTQRTTRKTFWQAYLATGKCNSMGVHNLGLAPDGSLLIAGSSAWGLIQTGNHLNTAAPAASYVAVLNSDLDAIRFSSGIPGGASALGFGSRPSFGIAGGNVGGKSMAVFVSGVVRQADVYGKIGECPTRNAIQKTYGGGQTDAYLLVLDLSKASEGKQP